MTQETAAATYAAADIAGKYLTFELGHEEYGVQILKVREIIGLLDITSLPKMPPCVKGVINLRGKIIPVIDLAMRFNMPPAQRTEETCIIVVEVGEVEVGVIVDRVCEVSNIAVDDIEGARTLGASLQSDFILGISKAGGKVTILLEIDKALAGADVPVPQALPQVA